MTKSLTEKAVKKELRGYYYAGVHQYEGECDEDRFVAIVCCDQYGVSYESCYDGWDYIIQEVPDYEDVRYMESQIARLQEQLNEANKLLKYCCANYESSRFGATITEDGEILPKGPVWNYLKKWKEVK